MGVALSLEGPHPSCKVSLDDDGLLHWPVLFLYPEYGTSDLIESFNENDRYMYTCVTSIICIVGLLIMCM